MANIYEKYRTMCEKLATLMDEHNLIYVFKTEAEPITLEVKRNESEKVEQLSLVAQGRKSSSDAKISFIFDGGEIIVNTEGELFMTEALINKIKNIAKKLHYLYLHLFYVDNKARAKRFDCLNEDTATEEETEEVEAEA